MQQELLSAKKIMMKLEKWRKKKTKQKKENEGSKENEGTKENEVTKENERIKENVGEKENEIETVKENENGKEDLIYCPIPYEPNDSDENLDYCKNLALPDVPKGDDDENNLYVSGVTYKSCCFLEYQLSNGAKGKSCLSLINEEVLDHNKALENLLKIFPGSTGTITCKEDNNGENDKNGESGDGKEGSEQGFSSYVKTGLIFSIYLLLM